MSFTLPEFRKIRLRIAGVMGGLALLLPQIEAVLDADPATVLNVETVITAVGIILMGLWGRDQMVTSGESGAKAAAATAAKSGKSG